MLRNKENNKVIFNQKTISVKKKIWNQKKIGKFIQFCHRFKKNRTEEAEPFILRHSNHI